MYTLDQLKIFIAVVEHGSFSATARSLGRSQSGISQAIANLEIAINQELFDRSGHTPHLTHAGKTLLPIAQAILQQSHFFEQTVTALEQQQEPELIIAIEESLFDPELLKRLCQIHTRYPITIFDIASMSTFDIERLIKTGEVHIGVVYLNHSFKTEMDFFQIGQVNAITVVSPQHPLAQNLVVTALELQQYRQLVHRTDELKELWFSDRISSQVWYANNHQILLEMACQNVGWTVLPEQLAQPYLTSGRLVKLNLDFELGGITVPVGILMSRQYQHGQVSTAVTEIIQHYFKT